MADDVADSPLNWLEAGALRVVRAARRRMPPPLRPFADPVAGPVVSALEARQQARRQEELVRDRPKITATELLHELRDLHLPVGRIVFVHSSLKSLGFVDGGAATVLDALCQVVVGDGGGTLALPTFSGGGMVATLTDPNYQFDARTTPTSVVQITNLFRKLPKVLSSIHPTHSVAALGPEAAWLTQDHHLADTTFGRNTPLARLLEHNGLLLGLGTSLGPVTFYHVLEDLRPDFPLRVYTTSSPYPVNFIDITGKSHAMRVSAYDPAVSKTRVDTPGGLGIRAYITKRLQAKEILRRGRVGAAAVWWLETAAMYRELKLMLAEGITIYSQFDVDAQLEAPVGASRLVQVRRLAGQILAPIRGAAKELRRPAEAKLALARDQAGLALRPDPGAASVAVAALQWLLAAQRHSASADGGFARAYTLGQGWQASHPETTGYIVDTLFDPRAELACPAAPPRRSRLSTG